jgi:hypothetical protein
MQWKIAIILQTLKRFVFPALLSMLVLWLIANEFAQWVPIVCGVSEIFAIDVSECETWVS